MTTMEKAYKIRNLYNSWKDQSRKEAMLYEKLSELSKEIAKATYSKNGYEHFRIFGAWLSQEEVKRQEKKLFDDQEKARTRLNEIEEEIEQLLTETRG